MEGLGKKLKEARLARNLTLDEAGRMTKIRPDRLEDIENEDFSKFDSLAYPKAFVLTYGRFLDVDVSPYLEEFETSETITVDGYSYLQDNPAPKPSRPVVVRKHSGGGGGGRSSFLPFVVGVIVLVVGFLGMKWILEVQRLKPKPNQVIGTTPAPTASAETIIAPHALPVETVTPVATVASPTPAVAIAPSPQPTVTVPSPIPQPSAAEPEVRRAEPVNPQVVPRVRPSVTPRLQRQYRPGTNFGPRPTPLPRPVPPR